MKRVILMFVLVAALAAASTATAGAVISVPYCPAFYTGTWFEQGGIQLEGYAACGGGNMYSWYGEAKLQYEQGGKWHRAAPLQKLRHHEAGFSGPLGGIVGLDFAWGNLPVHPYKAYQWRAIVGAVDVQTRRVIVWYTSDVLPIGGPS